MEKEEEVEEEGGGGGRGGVGGGGEGDRGEGGEKGGRIMGYTRSFSLTSLITGKAVRASARIDFGSSIRCRHRGKPFPTRADGD